MSEQAISLLQQILHKQQKQTDLLQTIADQNLALIEALAEVPDDDQDKPPTHYLSGKPCR